MFIYYYLEKFWAYFGKIYMVLGKNSVFQMAKYWTNTLTIWSHWLITIGSWIYLSSSGWVQSKLTEFWERFRQMLESQMRLI